MTLNAKQAQFSLTAARFIVWCHESGFPVLGAELYRTPEQAEIYARDGRGIKNSCHVHKLAIDLFRVVDGRVTFDDAEYAAIGAHWKTMHPLARWGGDFRRRDVYHFSFEHRGVM